MKEYIVNIVQTSLFVVFNTYYNYFVVAQNVSHI